ncbi:hypothetical protein ACWFMH_20010, partial [Bacillus altitudinis]
MEAGGLPAASTFPAPAGLAPAGVVLQERQNNRVRTWTTAMAAGTWKCSRRARHASTTPVTGSGAAQCAHSEGSA